MDERAHLGEPFRLHVLHEPRRPAATAARVLGVRAPRVHVVHGEETDGRVTAHALPVGEHARRVALTAFAPAVRVEQRGALPVRPLLADQPDLEVHVVPPVVRVRVAVAQVPERPGLDVRIVHAGEHVGHAVALPLRGDAVGRLVQHPEVGAGRGAFRFGHNPLLEPAVPVRPRAVHRSAVLVASDLRVVDELERARLVVRVAGADHVRARVRVLVMQFAQDPVRRVPVGAPGEARRDRGRGQIPAVRARVDGLPA